MSDALLQEAADALRWARAGLEEARTAIVAFGDPKWAAGLDQSFERLGRTIQAVDDVLQKLPSEVPLTAEEEAKVARVVAAALNKRFGDGTAEEVGAAVDDWFGQ
jgi:hypothetical protein